MPVDVDEATRRRIEEIAKTRGISPADVIRAAVEKYATDEADMGSWLERAEAFGLVGCSTGGPSDLSTNKDHLEGFGRD